MTALGWTLLILATAAPGDPATTLEATTPVSGELDRCLDHAVKELGMSAKQVEKERRWNIGPQFLHPSLVPAGTLEIQMRPGEQQTLVQVTARWPGGPKDRALQDEIESRVTAIASKLAQICGVMTPAVRCTLSAGVAPAAACRGR